MICLVLAVALYLRGADDRGANRIAAPSLPYTFEYPGSWHRDPPTDLPLLPRIGNLTSVSSDKEAATVENGVLVGTFSYRSEGLFDTQMKDLLSMHGTLLSRSVQRVAGLPAVRYDYDHASAYDGSVTTVFSEGRGYWIQCLYKADKQATDRACAQILASFQTRDKAPAARAAGRDVN